MIGNRMNGYITPDNQAEFLSKHAHLLGIVGNEKFYEYNNMGFKVITIGDCVAQVMKIPVDDARMIILCKGLNFGGF